MPQVVLRGGEVDGLDLHYTVEGRGPAVVLVHGLGGFAETWRRTIAPLAERATVYAFDLPGHGQSGKPRASYRLAWLARVLHGFLDTLGVRHASLVGHSLGGAVAVTYALVHPARVERLALLGALVPGAAFRLPWTARALALPVVGEALGFLARPRLCKAAIAGCFHAPDAAEVDFLVDTRFGERTSAAARGAWLATVRGLRADLEGRRADYRRALATLEQPVLLVHGRQDPAVPAAHCAEALAALPRAAVRWVDACGHFPHLEHAAVVNPWLTDFLAPRPAPR
jgi:pimeloyl-ACP methyl ester carboxylesterase